MANGARGTIVDIVLSTVEEPSIPEASSVVELKHLPLYILVKLDRTRVSQLEGLDEQVIPIQPRQQTLRILVQQKNGEPVLCSVWRQQYPFTLAYAFTDYRSQGQTIVPVIIDIATPPTASSNLFNTYVAPGSRSSGRDNEV